MMIKNIIFSTHKSVIYIQRSFMYVHQINSILKIKNDGYLRWATTTCCPHVCLFSSQLFMYTLPLLPHTGPSRAAPVQDSGHIWNILELCILIYTMENYIILQSNTTFTQGGGGGLNGRWGPPIESKKYKLL